MMKTYLKRAFQLSDSGVKGLAKSIWSFFLYYVSFVPPMICVFLFADRLLNGNTGKPVVYLLFMLAATLVMYLVINYEIAASLDVETEVQIQTGLNHLIQGKTVIVISHRLKSIENADKIVVMKAGTVEACGKHAHLLKQSPTYRKMIEKSNLAEIFNY